MYRQLSPNIVQIKGYVTALPEPCVNHLGTICTVGANVLTTLVNPFEVLSRGWTLAQIVPKRCDTVGTSIDNRLGRMGATAATSAASIADSLEDPKLSFLEQDHVMVAIQKNPE